MNAGPDRDRHRTLVLSWHPEEGHLAAGGFRRSREIVKHVAADSELLVIDAAPSMFRDLDGLEITEYAVPELKRVVQIEHRIARAVQWSVASSKLFALGLREFRRRPFDAIYVPTSELLVCSLPATLLRLVTRRRLVMCNQNAEGVFAQRITLALHNRADAVTSVSDALRQALKRAGVRTHIDVTGNGPPLVEHDDSSAPVDKRWDGIFIGRHTVEKGIDDVLDIWERVRLGRPGAKLVLVGACTPATKRRIGTKVDAMRARGDVHIAGVVSDRRKFELLRSARVLVAPSHVEGWGLVPLEALHVGLPVVCWDLPAYRESLPESSRVRRIPMRDVDRFSQRVLEALDEEPRGTATPDAPSPQLEWKDVAAREWAVVDGRRAA